MNNPIRILHVLGRLDLAGAETFVMNIYKNIDKKKIQFDFIVHGNEKGFYEKDVEALGGRIYRVPKYLVINISEYKNWWRKFFELHKEYKIIHCHIRSTANIILKIAREYSVVTISHSHSISNGNGIRALIKNFNQRNISRYSDYKFACSKDAGRWLYGENQEFEVIKNAIPVERFLFSQIKRENFRKKYNIENKHVYGHVGRFSEEKNHIFLIDVFKNILEKDKDAILLLVGNGSLEEKVKDRILSEQLSSKVFLLGNQEDVSSFMCGIDMFIFPSKYEGLGIVLVEAQASGVPCLASDRIPKDINLTNLIKQIPIEDSKEFAKIATGLMEKNSYDQNRKYYNDIIKKAGYDCVEISSYLKRFYEGLYYF